MVGDDVIMVIHRPKAGTDVCDTTTKSIDHDVTCQYLWILRFNSKTPVVHVILHQARMRYCYGVPYQHDNQPRFGCIGAGVGGGVRYFWNVWNFYATTSYPPISTSMLWHVVPGGQVGRHLPSIRWRRCSTTFWMTLVMPPASDGNARSGSDRQHQHSTFDICTSWGERSVPSTHPEYQLMCWGIQQWNRQMQVVMSLLKWLELVMLDCSTCITINTNQTTIYY